jgi:hypothetical protein
MSKKSNQIILWTLILLSIPDVVFSQISCGKKIPSLGVFDQISQYALWLALALMILGVLCDQKVLKRALLVIAFIPFLGWAYVNFIVDYNSLKKEIFNHNVTAEATLANIAEAQDRYKSEQGRYIGDLRKIYSHIGGAGGMSECVKILNVQAGFDHWRAEAGHVASPDTVIWDSRSGTSLKKG